MEEGTMSNLATGSWQPPIVQFPPPPPPQGVPTWMRQPRVLWVDATTTVHMPGITPPVPAKPAADAQIHGYETRLILALHDRLLANVKSAPFCRALTW